MAANTHQSVGIPTRRRRMHRRSGRFLVHGHGSGSPNLVHDVPRMTAASQPELLPSVLGAQHTLTHDDICIVVRKARAINVVRRNMNITASSSFARYRPARSPHLGSFCHYNRGYVCTQRRSRKRRMRALVELSCRSSGVADAACSGMIRCGRTLPSSTPHWFKDSIRQMTPWVNTLCSYKATSAPRL